MPHEEIKLVQSIRDAVMFRGDISLRRLAREAGVSISVIQQFVIGNDIRLSTAEKLYNAIQRINERTDRAKGKQ